MARFDMGRESYALFREVPNAVDMKPTVEKKMPGAFNSAARHQIRNFLEFGRPCGEVIPVLPDFRFCAGHIDCQIFFKSTWDHGKQRGQ